MKKTSNKKQPENLDKPKKYITFVTRFGNRIEMVDVAQSVRVTDCGSEGRGFESHLPPEF